MIRTLNVIALVVAVALAAALYIAKTEAKSAQERLETIQAQLAEERRQINVLNVEIAHLEEPDRLRQLARQYLRPRKNCPPRRGGPGVHGDEVVAFQEAGFQRGHDTRTASSGGSGARRHVPLAASGERRDPGT